MSETAAKLLEQVLALPDEDRRFVAERLWAELSDDPWDDPEFVAEMERRLEAVEKHPEQLLDGPTVLAQARERLRRRRGQ